MSRAMHSVSDLLALADQYAAATGLAEGTISERVLAGGGRLKDIRSGKSDIGFRRLQKAVLWFSLHWPEGASWPTGIARPTASEAA